jgi:hypothetical protein
LKLAKKGKKMKFDIQIKNLGKIQEANIKVRPLTLVAGVNSSGKSFFTKSLYSILKAVNEDYIGQVITHHLGTLIAALKGIESTFSNLSESDRENIINMNKYIMLLFEEVNSLSKIIDFKNFKNENYEILVNNSHFVTALKKLDTLTNNFNSKFKETPIEVEQIYLYEMQRVTPFLLHLIGTAKDDYILRLRHGVQRELQENFQVRDSF